VNQDDAAASEPALSRPRVPAGYGIPTQIDPSDEISWARTQQQLVAARNYWLATVSPAGRPHAMPVWGLWLDRSLLFSTDRDSRKGRNLAANPQIVVHLESGDDVVTLEGTVEEVNDRALLDRFVDAYDAKYQIRPDTSDTSSGIYRLRPRVVLTWLERDYPNTAARWQFS
jgi:PPOX class probable F420-dependent enzyme